MECKSIYLHQIKQIEKYSCFPCMAKLDIPKYDTIIFDLGGVILNIDYNLTTMAFSKLGLNDFSRLFSQANQSNLFDDLEKGKIEQREFVSAIQDLAGKHISENDIVSAWNAMLLDLPEERIKLLDTLKSKYRIFLLSNTNVIHKTAYCYYLEKTFGLKDFSHIFEKQYLSFEVGMRKPDAEIFEYVINQNELKREKTLFIDDSVQHIHGAQKAGIDAFHLTNGLSILDLPWQ